MDEQQKYARLFNDIDSQAMITLGVVLLSTIVLIIVSQRGLNWLATRLHGQVRFRIFALVPLTRLLHWPSSYRLLSSHRYVIWSRCWEHLA